MVPFRLTGLKSNSGKYNSFVEACEVHTPFLQHAPRNGAGGGQSPVLMIVPRRRIRYVSTNSTEGEMHSSGNARMVATKD